VTAWLLPLLPFVAAVAGILIGLRTARLAAPIAVAGAAAATALALRLVTAAPLEGAAEQATQLTPTGSIPIALATYVDGLSATVAVLVCLVALAVQVYSVAYMKGDARYSSYAALISLFTAAMLLVVLSGDLVVLLVGWEVMGICSYFLIGHYWEQDWVQGAAVKAFLMTKAGDIPFLFGIFTLGLDAGSFRIADVFAALDEGQLEHLGLATLLLLGGVIGKSAQFPLHSWLPDAMAGPTPISALIHAATMVAAGVYAIARLWPLYLDAESTRAVLAVIAAITMLGSALAAFAQNDIKRVLAYSTVSQLAYMAASLAAGGRDASIFHLLTHGAYKALLFLGAGAVIHVVATNLMTEMGGLRKGMPITFLTTTVGLAALAGVPPFSGFFSKEAVLAAVEHGTDAGRISVPAGAVVLISGLLTVLVTAAYVTRLWLMTFFGPPRTDPRGHEVRGHEAPPLMTVPLVLLAIPSALLGFAAPMVPGWIRSGDIEPESLAPAAASVGISVLLVFVGGYVTYAAWARSRQGDPARILGRYRPAVERAFYVDELYGLLFTRPTWAAARTVLFTDRVVVDGYVEGSGTAARLAAALLRLTQTGNVQTYLTGLLAVVVVGLAVVAGVSAA
jgi:NADH-quinone oxidoreductase subunit L